MGRSQTQILAFIVCLNFSSFNLKTLTKISIAFLTRLMIRIIVCVDRILLMRFNLKVLCKTYVFLMYLSLNAEFAKNEKKSQSTLGKKIEFFRVSDIFRSVNFRSFTEKDRNSKERKKFKRKKERNSKLVCLYVLLHPQIITLKLEKFQIKSSLQQNLFY